MAYRRKRTYARRSRRPYRRRARYTTMGSALHLAKKAAKGVYYLKGLVNSELMKRTTSQGNLTIPYPLFPPVPQLMTGIPVGDDDSERTGNSVLLRYLNIRALLKATPLAGGEYLPGFIRIIVFRDTQQASDTTPTLSDVLQFITPTSFLNPDTVGRYTILRDKLIQLNNDRPYAQFNYTLSTRAHLRFNGPLSTDVQKDHIYFVAFATDSFGSASNPTMDLATRISYHDN